MALELTATDLACTRGASPIFSGVTFRLGAGDLLVARGPNGSGKSSLLRVLGGLIKPSSGEIRCATAGGPIPHDELGRAVHLIGHRTGITDAMSALENLVFQTALLGGPSAGVASALERVGLGGSERARAHMLSAGQRRRLALARLIAVPRGIWLLDEPTEALDAAGESLVTTLIDEHRAGGGIVVVATHGALAARVSVELRLIPPTTLRAA